MAGFVRNHSDHLSRGPGPHDQTGIDEQVQPAGHERVERPIIDQKDFDRRRFKVCRFEKWCGINADDTFCFRIPEERGFLCGRLVHRQGEGAAKSEDGHEQNATRHSTTRQLGGLQIFPRG